MGVKPYNAQTGTTLYIFMTLILLVVVCPMWLALIRPRKPREATRTWWEFNSSRILHVANPNKLLASQSQSIEPEPEQLYTYIWDGLSDSWLSTQSSRCSISNARASGQITSNFLTQASWRLYEIRQPHTSLCTMSSYRVVFLTGPPKKWLSVRLHVNPFKKVLSVRIS